MDSLANASDNLLLLKFLFAAKLFKFGEWAIFCSLFILIRTRGSAFSLYVFF